jgi:hypothetical protein
VKDAVRGSHFDHEWAVIPRVQEESGGTWRTFAQTPDSGAALHRSYRPCSAVALATATISLLAAVPAVAASGPGTYRPAPFAGHCTVHHFREAQAPDLTAYPDDPLCVEYQKRDITADNGGAVRFLAAEPSRFAIALPKCRYWQQDHWRVQVDRSAQHLVQWDGSYWFDKGSGRAGAILRHFRVDGHHASAEQAERLIATASPTLAAIVRSYGASADVGVPLDPRCPR